QREGAKTPRRKEPRAKPVPRYPLCDSAPSRLCVDFLWDAKQMHHFDQSSAECLVFTRKEGLLSAVAHNLKIRVTKFVIDVDEAARTVEGRFDSGSLRVVCAMQGDVEMPDALTADNKREIERN